MVDNPEGEPREPKMVPFARFPKEPKIVRRIMGRSVPNASKSMLTSHKDRIAAGVARATKAWKEYWANREYNRDAVYEYLEVVSDIIREWEALGMANKYSLEAVKRDGLAIRMKPDPYARLIFCSSSKVDPKTRSKWAQVLRYAEDNKKEQDSLTKFVKRNGGLNECVEVARLSR